MIDRLRFVLRVAGVLLMVALVWLMAGFAVLLFPLQPLLSHNARESARALDQLCNATFFNGLGRESMSSHAWRDRIRLVLWVTSVLDCPQHCAEANRHEQPIVDAILRH